jgi:hypothetical protein
MRKTTFTQYNVMDHTNLRRSKLNTVPIYSIDVEKSAVKQSTYHVSLILSWMLTPIIKHKLFVY